MKTDTRQSFSAKVKAELIRLPLGKACCMLSEISALTMTSGHLAFRGGGWISISYRLDDAGFEAILNRKVWKKGRAVSVSWWRKRRVSLRQNPKSFWEKTTRCWPISPMTARQHTS